MELLTYPDPRLKIVCDPIIDPTQEWVHDMLNGMKDLMYEFMGYGISAPQVGFCYRAIIIHPPKSEYIELINPEIERLWGGKFLSDEGCLSWPGKRHRLMRFRQIKVRGLNRFGERVCYGGKQLRAAALQHELEHLDGINLADHAGESWETDNEREAATAGLSAGEPTSRSGHMERIPDPAMDGEADQTRARSD